MSSEKVAANAPPENVLVNFVALWAVVNYLFYEEEKDYGGQESHIYRDLLPLAEACGYIESAEKRLVEKLAEIQEEIELFGPEGESGDDDEDDEDDEDEDEEDDKDAIAMREFDRERAERKARGIDDEVDRLLDELNS
jgi:hypothetical protein